MMNISTHWRYLALISFLLTTFFSYAVGRHLNVTNIRIRQKRQQGAELFLPSNSVVPGGEGGGGWGPWEAPSSCSRSCGGGVSSQLRRCADYYADGSPRCQGGDKKYFSCNTQDCPEGSLDFRSEQCSNYDSTPFEGVTYQWVPYTKAPNPCELNCMPRGERFYYRHNNKVTDGTLCDEESLDVCVDGECLPVGCDMMLGSKAREDKCRECGGDGSSCKTTSGVYDKDDLTVGYNDILLIPQGATNIVIKEQRPSNNYLAIRNKEGEFYLNGNWRIDFPRSFTFAGAIWHYERKPQGFAAPDSLKCLGQTSEPVYLVMLYQGANVGVSYEYSVPQGIAHSSDDEYAWVHDAFTHCSASCGGGYQVRNVTCASQKELTPVDDSLCDEALKPAVNQTCSNIPCAASWKEGEWEECSEACGDKGVQSRQIYCHKIVLQGLPSVVNDDECFQLLGSKPPQHQKCNVGLPCPEWHVGPWNPCDKLCGEGKQRRNIRCFRKVDGKIEVLDDDQCAETKPEKEKSCFIHPCDGVDWVVSDWSGCDSCLSKVKTRSAHCATKKGEIFPSSFCANHPEPVLQADCDAALLPACDVQWYSSEWSKCSGKCGDGVQSRRVFCGLFNGESLQKVADERCDIPEKPKDTQPCELTPEQKDCPPEWHYGPFSECSKECGGGEQIRKVLCLSENKTASGCEVDSILDSTQQCNLQACTEDEVLPVNVGSTQPVTDYEDEEWCDDEDYDSSEEDGVTSAMDESATETSLDDLMMSDGPTSSGDGEDTSVTDDGNGLYSPEMDITGTIDFGSGDDSSTTDSESSTSPVSPDSEGTTTSDDLVSGSTDSSESSSEGSTEAESSTDVEISTEASSDSSMDSSSESSQSSIDTTDSSSTDASSIDSSSSDASSTDASIDSSSDSSASIDSSIDSSSDSSASSDSSTEASSTDVSDASSDASIDDSSTDSSSENSSIDSSSDAPSTDSTSDASSLDSSTDSSTGVSSSDSTITDDTTTEFSSSDSSSQDASSTDASSIDSSSVDASSTEDSSTDSSTDITTAALSTDVTTDGQTTTEEYKPPLAAEFDPESEITHEDETTIASSDSSTDSSSDLSTDSTGSTESTELSSDSSTDGSTDSSTDGSTDSSTEISTEVSTEISTEVSSDSSTDGSTDSSTDSSFDGSTDSSSESSSDYSTDSSTDESSTLSGSTDISSTDESTSEGSTEQSSSEGSTIEQSTDLTESTSEVSTETEDGYTESSTSSWGWGTNTVGGTKDGKKCKRRPKKSSCLKSTFGCCFDNKTAATGPFEKDCPNPATCKVSKHGCCPDGVSAAAGADGKGCPVLPCNETLFGCCSDKKTAAQGNNQDGCPPPCKSSKYGCCADGKQEATGKKKKGCPESIVTTSKAPPVDCSKSKHGCCADNSTAASGPNKQGCPCEISEHGCCPDQTAATGPNQEGCIFICTGSTFGCCPDKETPAHGPNGEGCCLSQAYGCCPDNIVAARGPGFEGCGCQWSPYGCCPDNTTTARGHGNEGCSCEHTPHGCCPNKHTPAQGPKFEGCACYTFQFGCCPDGKRVAKGPRGQGCGCQESEFGCCSDGQTQAGGPEKEGCDCSSSKFGCCPDGQAEATGPEFEGCVDKPVNLQAACSLEKERGPCRGFKVKWYYDTVYGGCSRFWYGDCEGNGNRFNSKEECSDVCVEPVGRDICKLPKMKGPCENYNPTWYFDSERKQCGQFFYGGCLGNNNRFPSREDCQKQCEDVEPEDVCVLETDPGQCSGNFTRWSFNAESGSCQPFTWGGCEGNGNRFISESACILQCDTPGKAKDMCPLPLSAGNCTQKLSKWFFDPAENRCMPFYYTGCEGNTNQFDSEQQCDQKCPKVVEQDICTLPSATGECAEYRERWFYDTAEKRCRQFYYGGCGGNTNNFPTQQECDARCGEREVTTTVQPEQAYGQEICFLPIDPKPCPVTQPRWFYDSSDGVCKQFRYGNCQSRNQNNFREREDCEAHCSTAQDLCQLPMAVGPCDNSVTQWFYDKNTDSCSQFAYGGCQGNGNRFNVKSDCEQRCKQGPVEPEVDPNIISPATPRPRDALPEVCLEPLAAGDCRESLSVWAYDPSTGRCANFLYSGCGGNGNRFLSEEQCERQCGQFRSIEVCRYPKDVGICKGNFQKYFFDSEQHQCLEFVWGGCRGTPNRFSTQAECNAVCVDHRELPPDTAVQTSEAICKLHVDTGNCVGAYFRRYYFSEEFGRCLAFIYTGCGGNSNNFRSMQACTRTCAPEHSNEIDVDTRYDKEETDEPEPPRQEVDPCKQYRDLCAGLRCPYGDTRSVQQDGCERCECNNPCADTRCEEGSRCVVDFYRDRDTGETRFTPVCRQDIKEGECPVVAEEMDENAIAPSGDRCDRECNTDADCSAELKCCRRGCSLACVRPVERSQPAYTVQPTQFNYPPGAEPPRIDDTVEREVSAEEGNVATLRCLVYGNPPPSITWRKESIYIDGKSGRHRIMTDGSLKIISLYRNDSGVYICVADNGIGPSVQKEVTLQVSDPTPHAAEVIPGEERVVGTLGSSLVLRCSAFGWPSPTVQWWQGETMLPIDSQHYERRRDHSLLIRSLQITQLGEYACQAYNGIGKPGSWKIVVQAVRPLNVIDPIYEAFSPYLVASADSVVIVTPRPYRPNYASPSPSPTPEEPSPEINIPEIPREPSVVYTVPVSVNLTLTQRSFPVGSDLSLLCSVEGYPLPEVSWLRDNIPLYTGGRIDISESNRLTVYRVNTTDSGTYNCTARNLYSSAYASVTINVEGQYIHPNCTDNPFFANCKLIVQAHYCSHEYYAKFCCRSCTMAGLLPSYESRLGKKKK